ncbi:leucine-rich repeat-containing G-protein coupled receptor 4-like [Mytilus edulis]
MDVFEVLTFFVFFCVVLSEFQCPKQLQTTGCTCKQLIWWNNENKTIVNCSMANLQTVPDFKVLNTYEISHLILSHNNISEITSGDFTDLMIKEMDISANPIVSFETVSSILPRHLNTLIAKKSKISLDADLAFFRGLENLTELILDSNVLENNNQTLPGNIFKDLNLKSLRKLSLQSCEIGGIHSKAFTGLRQLEELDLSYNYLEEVPEAIQSLYHLKKLILLGNNVMHLKDNTFHGLQYLHDLNLNVNEISKIDVHAFSGLEHSLKDIRLHYNNLNTIPYEALRKLKNLSFLVLSRNNITLIPKDAFVGVTNLRILELDSNTLTYYDEMFNGLENSLETLTLRETGLRVLPVRSLLFLKRLTDLDVSHNRIISLSYGDIGKLKLKTVDISHNHLTIIQPDTFIGISRTIGLDLDNNKLTNLSFVLHVTPCAFSYIDVSGNDVICDCDTEKIINSGIVLGVGPTGNCKIEDDPSNHKYKLGTTALSRELEDRCNRTERVFDCQTMELQASTASLITKSLNFVFTCTLLCYFVSMYR